MSEPKEIKVEQFPKLSDECMIEESNFKKLTECVSEFFQKTVKMDNSLIKPALSDIKSSFQSYKFTSIDFSKIENAYAYFIMYSLLNMAVSRNRFLNAIKNCEELSNRINELSVNVVSLGGGPGTDMIGFCSALQECSEKSDTLLNLTVVDLFSRWASFYNLIEFCLREKNFGYASKLFQKNDVNSSFIKADLRDKTPPKKYDLDLKEADIVLLVRVLDIFNYERDNADDVFENIAEKMKKDAFLLLVNSGEKEYKSEYLKKMYLSHLNEFELQVSPSLGRPYSTKNSKANIAVYKKI